MELRRIIKNNSRYKRKRRRIFHKDSKAFDCVITNGVSFKIS
jgi:hypothetical protein